MGVGPRIARVHIGSGRPGLSSGAGPVTVWTGVGSRKRRKRSSSSRSSSSIRSYEAAARQAERLEQVRAALAIEAAMIAVHREEFPPVVPPVADPVESVNEAAVHEQHRRAALAGIGLFSFSARREAKDKAKQSAATAIVEERARRERERADQQAELDENWRLLLANDPAAVMYSLEEAFEDNNAPAVPIDCADGHASVVMLYAAASAIPERKPAVTPTGRPTMHVRSKTERNELYAQSLASNVLATVREGFAVAPNLRRLTVLTVCKDDALGGVPLLSALVLCGFERSTVERFNWERLNPLTTLEAGDPFVINRKGRTGDLAPLDLTDEPDIAAVLTSFAEMLDLAIDPRMKMPDDALQTTRPAPTAEPPRRLLAVRDAEGMPDTFGVLLRDPGKAIGTIKILRERTGLSLRDAKSRVEAGGVIAHHLELADATSLSAALNAAGARAEVMPDQTARRTETRYCHQCGHPLEPEDRFCRDCGTPIVV
jgi:ribosomal protein L7/L12